MAETSPDKVKVSQIQQVCIICKDIQKTMEAYWNILGIGPWMVTEFGQPTCPDMKYYGKPVWGRCRQAMVSLGPVELELLQPLEGVSIYHDWLREHGETFHHMKFLVEDLDIDRVERGMVRLGLLPTQSGHFGPKLIYKFAYFDTEKSLKVVWVSSNRTGGTPVGAAFYPEDKAARSPAKVKVKEVKKVSICVKDAVRTAENYWNILGIGPWEVGEWGSYALYDRTYHGRPAWGREKLARANLGDLELELIQPVEGDSAYFDWLAEHGEGIHHLGFLCDDSEQVAKTLAEQGFSSLQGGHFGSPGEKAGGFDYIDIPPLHCIWEPVHKPKGLPLKPIERVPTG